MCEWREPLIPDVRKAQVRPLLDQQIHRKIDRILIGLAKIREKAPKLIGDLDVPTHRTQHSMDGIYTDASLKSTRQH
jgi:hypothetical protein